MNDNKLRIVASNADYIVTQDKHFQVLKEVEFPKVHLLNIEEFKTIIGK